MPTGDGLLVRFQPHVTTPLEAFAAFCAAAQRHGNGIVEVTSRGSLQVRGLNMRSAPRFAAEMAGLKIAVEEGGVALLCSPLSGIDPLEVIDCAPVASDLRRQLATASFRSRLGAKVCVVLDGGGAVNLAGIPADIRFCARTAGDTTVFQVSVGGGASGASPLGVVTAGDAPRAAFRLLELIAEHGNAARARDIVAAEGIAPFQAAISHLLLAEAVGSGTSSRRIDRQSRPAIGVHPLCGGSLAYGVGLAFGHATAISLARLIEAAQAAGAQGLRPAPARMLFAVGLAGDAAPAFAAAAARFGFITRAGDPRRFVVACAGAPICASAHIAARAIAPRIVDLAATDIDGSRTIHVSGCAKGCAQSGPAMLTMVGTADGCALVANGSARDAPFAYVATGDAVEAAVRYVRERRPEAGHG